jgi:hypothetical protein
MSSVMITRIFGLSAGVSAASSGARAANSTEVRSKRAKVIDRTPQAAEVSC